jgi:hypothetical protein
VTEPVAEVLEAKGHIESYLRKVIRQQEIRAGVELPNRGDGRDVRDSDHKATSAAV